MKRLLRLALLAVAIVTASYIGLLSYNTSLYIHVLEEKLADARKVHTDHTNRLNNLRQESLKFTSAKRLARESQQRLNPLMASFATSQVEEYVPIALKGLNAEKVVVLRQALPRPPQTIRTNIVTSGPNFWLLTPFKNQRLCIRIEKFHRNDKNYLPRNPALNEVVNGTKRELLKEKFLDLSPRQVHFLASKVQAPSSSRESALFQVSFDGEIAFEQEFVRWDAEFLQLFFPQRSGVFEPNRLELGSSHPDTEMRFVQSGCWLPLFSRIVSVESDKETRHGIAVSVYLATEEDVKVRPSDSGRFSNLLPLVWSQEDNAFLVSPNEYSQTP